MVSTTGAIPRRAVFLDRDGVIVVPEFRNGRSYAPRRLEDYRFYPEAKDALERLKNDFLLIVVSNQPDVGKGLISHATIEQMNSRLMRDFPIDRIEVCVHTQTDECACRKPKPGMLLNAARECHIDLSNSFMVGDRASDIAAGAAAGCQTIFVDLDYSSEPKPTSPNHTVRSIAEAADIISGIEPKAGGRICRVCRI